jgi:hypothetical protein
MKTEKSPYKESLEDRRKAMDKEKWISNVLRIYPEKTREEAEELHDVLFSGKLKK